MANRKSGWRAALGLLLGALLLSGCSESRTEIRIVGSSTVFPFATAVVENFVRRHPRMAAPVVEATGTGGGIKLFCRGAGPRYPDIVTASRRMTRRELQDCLTHGTGAIVEVQIGIDGVVIVQAKSAPPLGLSRRQIYLALAADPAGKAQRAVRWRDVGADLPDMPIRVLGPSPTSGTRDAFNDLYMQPGCKAAGGADKASCARMRSDGPWVDSGDNDNLIVQKLVSDPRAIGVLGYSYLARNRDQLRDVRIDGVAADAQTIADFRYPAARPLYIYVKAGHVHSVRGLAELLQEFSSDAAWGPGGYLARRGLVPSAAATRAANRARIDALTPLSPAALQ